MEDRSKHIDDLFREGLKDHQETPPASVWASLEQRLPAAAAPVAEQPSRRWMWILLLLLLLATVGYFIIRKSSESSTGERKLINQNTNNVAPSAPTPSTLPAHQDDIDSTASMDGGSTGTEPGGTATSSDIAAIENKGKTQRNGRNTNGNGRSRTHQGVRTSEGVAKNVNQGVDGGDIEENENTGPDDSNINIKDQAEVKKNARTPVPASGKKAGVAKTQASANNFTSNGTDSDGEVTENGVSGTKAAKNTAANKAPSSSKNNAPNASKGKSSNGNTAQTQGGTPLNTSGTGAAVNVNNTNAKTTAGNNKEIIDARTEPKDKQAGKVESAPAKNDATNQNKQVAPQTQEEKSGKPAVAEQGKKENVLLQELVENSKKTTANTGAVANKPVAAKPTPANGDPQLVTPEKAAAMEKDKKGNVLLQEPAQNNKKATDNSGAVANITAPGKTAAASEKPIAVTPEKAAGKPIAVEPELAKGKPINVSAEKTTAAKPIIVEPQASNGKAANASSAGAKNKPVVALLEPPKNREIAVNTGKPQAEPVNTTSTRKPVAKTTQANPEPAAKQPKKKYERTEDGIVLNMAGEDDEAEEGTDSPNEPAEEDEPAQPSPKGGGGGGGGADPVRARKSFSKMKVEGGIKVGYDRGFSQITTSNLVIAPFLQWNVSPRVSVAVQPGVRYNQINKPNIFGAAKDYHRVTSAFRDSLGSFETKGTQGAPDSLIRQYNYHNMYDSIRIGVGFKEKSYWEIELPLMLKYYVAPNLAIFGGVAMTFGNIVQIQEDRQEFTGLKKTNPGAQYGPVPFDSLAGAYPAPNPLPPAMVPFSYNTPEISTANPVTAQNPATNPARFGYLLGFSYELRRRLLIDFLVRQNLSDMRFIPNEQVRKIYTQPYLRLMVGYKLFGDKKERDVNPNGL